MKNGKADGNGSLSWPNGTVYEGEFQNDVMQGNGKLTYPDGKVLEGKFINGILIDE